MKSFQGPEGHSEQSYLSLSLFPSSMSLTSLRAMKSIFKPHREGSSYQKNIIGRKADDNQLQRTIPILIVCSSLFQQKFGTFNAKACRTRLYRRELKNFTRSDTYYSLEERQAKDTTLVFLPLLSITGLSFLKHFPSNRHIPSVIIGYSLHGRFDFWIPSYPDPEHGLVQSR